MWNIQGFPNVLTLHPTFLYPHNLKFSSWLNLLYVIVLTPNYQQAIYYVNEVTSNNMKGQIIAKSHSRTLFCPTTPNRMQCISSHKVQERSSLSIQLANYHLCHVMALCILYPTYHIHAFLWNYFQVVQSMKVGRIPIITYY